MIHPVPDPLTPVKTGKKKRWPRRAASFASHRLRVKFFDPLVTSVIFLLSFNAASMEIVVQIR